MALINQRITPEEINAVNVKSVAGSRLRGTVPENKHVFDKLPEFIAEHINGLIQSIIEEGADGLLVTLPNGSQITLNEYLSYLRNHLTYIIDVDDEGNETHVSFQEIITQILDNLNGEIGRERVTHLNGLFGDVEFIPLSSPPNIPTIAFFPITDPEDPNYGKIGVEIYGDHPLPHGSTHYPDGSDPAPHASYHQAGGLDEFIHADRHLPDGGDSIDGICIGIDY
jgi:hypothetical protein